MVVGVLVLECSRMGRRIGRAGEERKRTGFAPGRRTPETAPFGRERTLPGILPLLENIVVPLLFFDKRKQRDQEAIGDGWSELGLVATAGKPTFRILEIQQAQAQLLEL